MGSGMAGIEGAWTGQDVKVEIKSESPNTWKLSAKVANNMGCTITKDGETFEASPVMCTRMMPPPDLHEKENTLSKILSELTGINVEGSQLCLSGGSFHAPGSSLILLGFSPEGLGTGIVFLFIKSKNKMVK